MRESVSAERAPGGARCVFLCCFLEYANGCKRSIRRGTFRSVPDLVANIERFVENYNQDSRPFLWTATADSIIKKIQRLCEAVAGTGH